MAVASAAEDLVEFSTRNTIDMAIKSIHRCVGGAIVAWT